MNEATTPAQPIEGSLGDLALLGLPEVLRVTGVKTSTLYAWVEKGLWPRQVKVSSRCVRWPAGEVRQVARARIAGATETQIVELVGRLHAARTNGLDRLSLDCQA